MKKTETFTKYSVLYLNQSGKSVPAIAKELGLSQKEVKDIIKTETQSENNKIKTTSAPVNSKDLMITQTAAKGTKSVAIMTKAASEINDAFKTSLDQHVISRTSRDAIYVPNPKKK